MSVGKMLESEWNRRFPGGQSFRRLLITIQLCKVLKIIRFICQANWLLRAGYKKKGRPETPKLTRQVTPVRGKKGLHPREITSRSFWSCNLYFHVLRLPFPVFLVSWLGTYFMLSVLFSALLYVDFDGLHVERETDWPTWIEVIFSSTGNRVLTIFFYSLSVSTNFSGPMVDAHSPYTLFLGNLQALVAQVVTEFWCSAFLKRLSQPAKVVRWSNVGVISNYRLTSTMAGMTCPAKYRVLTLRFDLSGPYSNGLIDAKFDVLCVRMHSSRFPLHLSSQLSLVRKDAASITHGALLHHIIDESSPLFGFDMELMRAQDIIFGVTVRATEKTTMEPIFSEHQYSVYDDDILWDREFEDQWSTDEHGREVYNYKLLNSVRGLEDRRSSWEIMSTIESAIKLPAVPREQHKSLKIVLFLICFLLFPGRRTSAYRAAR